MVKTGAKMQNQLKENAQKIHYLVFQGLVMLGFLFHQLEDWKDRPISFFSIITLVLFVSLKKYREWVFLLFLTVTTVRYLILFPNLANHSNLNLFLFLAILPYQTALAFNKKNIALQNLIILIRMIVFTLYFFTFFHKLNWDFLNPNISCANAKLHQYVRLIPETWLTLKATIPLSLPWIGLVFEGLIPITLIFKKTRNFALFCLIGLHFILAPLGFTDFSSLAMALAWCFVDVEKIKTKNIEKHFTHLIGFCLFFEIILGFERYSLRDETHVILEGFLFITAYTPFLILHLWKKIEVRNLELPKNKYGISFITILFLFGFSNYLGLRTAGNFSMFSNLRTEGESSNHILLNTNPVKIYTFQEDVVEILKIDRQGRNIYKRMPRQGQKIPRVEFSRILDTYRTWGNRNIAMTVIYNDKIRTTEKAGFDSNFDLDSPWIYKKLLKFRAIEHGDQQLCQW